MFHLTLNTGHVARIAPDHASLSAIRALAPLIAAGGGVIPSRADHAVQLFVPEPGAALWTVSRGGVPLACCACCWRAQLGPRLWEQLERLYLGLSDKFPLGEMPEMPTGYPWLATALLPPILSYRETELWLADFDQCLAFALIESQ